MQTVEPTASFWDCGEFIACAYKLQVPHPPGAPLFLLLGRFFSLFAGADVTKVAYWINMLSVLTSALTVLFMHWTIVLIGRKAYQKPFSDLTQGETFTLLSAGFIGALAYAFSDSFWFSAVESEVYAMSSFFTAIVVWAAFKWELIEDEASANRWLIFIAYLVGLSIGVHLLNLVTVPALALLYYFKKTHKPSYKGGFLALLVGLVILGVINSLIIPGIPSMAFSLNYYLPTDSVCLMALG
jgi:membrane protein CcdC involved in cytochrome C biogenesis